jgi:subfamily B ATP-binding cassette protein MsbA
VAANISLGQVMDRAKVQACLEAANLAEHVAKLPLGIDTVLGHNAVELSGGQRQRLAIARALYKNAPILILDEATSSVDASTEVRLTRALDKLSTGRTTISIAHRLSTAARADRVLVLDTGVLVQDGSHIQLVDAPGVYSEMYKSWESSHNTTD